MQSLGISLGATSIGYAQVKNGKLIKGGSIPHDGDPKKILSSFLKKTDLSKFDYVGATGRKFRDYVLLPSITEPEATEYAFSYMKKDVNAIVSAGGETFMVYTLDSKGRISNVYTGNKCASGTGEFFLQQIRRMNLNVEEAIKVASTQEPHNVSGRCSVFCKSDCTHALNKGVPQGQVAAGLCQMMAKKIIELLAKVRNPKIMVVGGTALNKVVMKYLKDDIKDVTVPKEAPYFEALGAAIWSESNKKAFGGGNIFIEGVSSFSFLPPLKDAEKLVTFKHITKATAAEGDDCVLGLDVGSTTTKAVIIRKKDNAMLASIYLRTNGNPIKASRNCYKELAKQIKCKITISGLGVTGSGRQIAGLHAMTEGIINEIIAHATAAVYFDKDVDTIFEIGGQDAKYTFITNSVPSDYAMNEACSAGTGSFLEEAAKESMNVDVKDIADIALTGPKPPNFNDQCAAFISSDIKTAYQEGIQKADIIAGLVYSVCMNYANRVKGARSMGKKVYMQGGVCYNKAVPLAMAQLTGKHIIVPPEPGLMGAYGVALELKDRMKLNLIQEQMFDLRTLINRDVEYGKNFVCAGGQEKCDRKCEIMTIKIEGKTYPFGGACDKYYNQRFNLDYDQKKNNLVRLRQQLLYEKYSKIKPPKYAKTVGINKSFLTNTFYPLYYNFFTKLGMKVVLPDKVRDSGTDMKGASFCYPAEIAHGLYADLLSKKPDYIFMPLVLHLPVKAKTKHKITCVFVQAEHAYLKSAFKKKKNVLNPTINFSKGYSNQAGKFIEVASQMGVSRSKAEEAFAFAIKQQKAFAKEISEIGKKTIAELETEPDKSAVVLFGRTYNAFADEANMGIPDKLATRGALTIPVDFIPYENEEDYPDMYWGMGQLNLKAARFVKRHPQLFGTFISNFSCGPDSFIISYFRYIMGNKPSLTLELDSHTADAGLNTRIDAFIDILRSYRELYKNKLLSEITEKFKPAKIELVSGKAQVISSLGERMPLTSPRVRMIVPSMGRYGTEAFAACMRGLGINAVALPIPDMEVLKIGRANTSCKECLPMQLTTGSMLRYLEKRKEGEVTVYFMPKSSGPCRFGQYNRYMKTLILQHRIKDVAIMSLTADDSYAGLGNKFAIRSWKAVIIADVMTDIHSAIYALAKDRYRGLKVFEDQWKLMMRRLEQGKGISEQIEFSCRELRKIELKTPFDKAQKVSLIGEIYVRRDELSQQGVVEKLGQKGIVVKNAPIGEFVYYTNFVSRNKLGGRDDVKLKLKTDLAIRLGMQLHIEKRMKKVFAKSGLYEYEMIDIKKTIDHAKHLINPHFCGEAILTTGLALREIITHTSGIISIGPFACMPSRVAEAVLSEEMNMIGKLKASKKKMGKKFDNVTCLPFLPIETDGNPYPQIIEARLETLCLQSERLHKKMVSK